MKIELYEHIEILTDPRFVEYIGNLEESFRARKDLADAYMAFLLKTDYVEIIESVYEAACSCGSLLSIDGLKTPALVLQVYSHDYVFLCDCTELLNDFEGVKDKYIKLSQAGVTKSAGILNLAFAYSVDKSWEHSADL